MEPRPLGKIAIRAERSEWWVRVSCNGETIERGPCGDRTGARNQGIEALAEILGTRWAPGYALPCAVRTVRWEEV